MGALFDVAAKPRRANRFALSSELAAVCWTYFTTGFTIATVALEAAARSRCRVVTFPSLSMIGRNCASRFFSNGTNCSLLAGFEFP